MTNVAMQAALDQMTSSVGERKVAASAGLTPVGMERPVLRTPAPFPNDDIRSVAAEAIIDLTRVISHVQAGVDALKLLIGEPVETLVKPDQTAVEREADARVASAPVGSDTAAFRDRFEQKSRAAQSATFKEAVAADVSADDGWQCPDHGFEAIATLVSRRQGRKYRACQVAGCGRFET